MNRTNIFDVNICLCHSIFISNQNKSTPAGAIWEQWAFLSLCHVITRVQTTARATKSAAASVRTAQFSRPKQRSRQRFALHPHQMENAVMTRIKLHSTTHLEHEIIGETKNCISILQLNIDDGSYSYIISVVQFRCSITKYIDREWEMCVTVQHNF